jgi:hypothetical protein
MHRKATAEHVKTESAKSVFVEGNANDQIDLVLKMNPGCLKNHNGKDERDRIPECRV